MGTVGFVVDKNKNLVVEEVIVEPETIQTKILFRYPGCRCRVVPVTRHVDERQAGSGYCVDDTRA
jgi:hypothetical protein